MTHHTATHLATTHANKPIDWQLLRKIIHQDGNMMSGFSTAKTSTIRSYFIKSITNTLPTMKLLNSKWIMYDTDTCSRCFEAEKTNQHIWECFKAKEDISRILLNFARKYKIFASLHTDQ